MTPGGRLYLIRLACGDGLRRAEALVDFVKRVRHATGEDYLPTTVSMLERDLQNWRLSDVRAFAAVDPKQRGAAWLSALDVPAERVPVPAVASTRLAAADATAVVREGRKDEARQKRAKPKPRRKSS